MELLTKNEFSAADAGTQRIDTAQDALDLIAQARYEHNCDALIVRKENLCADFFTLSSGLAGEILQKFSNYRARLAVVGDFSEFRGKALRDFMIESNQAGRILFVESAQAALDRWSR